MKTTILKSIDTFVIIATTSSSITLPFIGIGIIVITISTGTARGLSISKDVLYEKNIQQFIKYKKQNEKCQQAK